MRLASQFFRDGSFHRISSKRSLNNKQIWFLLAIYRFRVHKFVTWTSCCWKLLKSFHRQDRFRHGPSQCRRGPQRSLLFGGGERWSRKIGRWKNHLPVVFVHQAEVLSTIFNPCFDMLNMVELSILCGMILVQTSFVQISWHRDSGCRARSTVWTLRVPWHQPWCREGNQLVFVLSTYRIIEGSPWIWHFPLGIIDVTNRCGPPIADHNWIIIDQVLVVKLQYLG